MDATEIKLAFLGTDRPALHSAADYLLEFFAEGAMHDMSSGTIVLPSARAGRQLKRRLLHCSNQLGTALFPPRIVTVGQLPELLYQPARSFADDLTQQLAWAKALQETDAETIANIGVGKHTATGEQQNNEFSWIEIGRLIWKQHKELSSENLSFADIAVQGANLPGFVDQRRWHALGVLQQTYLRTLTGLNLSDPFTARLEAICHGRCRFEGQLILLGTVDLNHTLRLMLSQVATAVTTLVHAPEHWKNRFDQYGCLRTSEWQHCEIGIPEKQWQVADGPLEQSQAVINCLREFGTKYATTDISVGLPDESLAPLLQRTFNTYQLPSRWGLGPRVSETAPIKLLSAVSNLLEGNQFHDFGALIRHSDVNCWLEHEGIDADYLTVVDELFQQRIPVTYTELVPKNLPSPNTDLVTRVTAKIKAILSPLVGPPRPIGEWSEPIANLLSTIYGYELDPNNEVHALVIKTSDEIHRLLVSFRQVPPGLEPHISAADALRFLIDDLGSVNISAPPVAGGIELLGWLELPLDDVPVLVLTSFDEEFVPSNIDADLFLPNALRTRLEIDNNTRRYARDAYALSVLIATRTEIRLIVARRNARNDPLLPSRLLFATDPETIAIRWSKILRTGITQESVVSPELLKNAPKTSLLPIPFPDAKYKFTRALSPTDFRSYLSCPYRFYLEHVLCLTTVKDDLLEMDAGLFGTIMHGALNRFGASKCADETEERAIMAALNHCLDQVVQQRFGQPIAPAVALQIEQIRIRLNAFASRQAKWRAQGWQIRYTEVPRNKEPIPFRVDDHTAMLTGRIDRIDFHAETGRWAIWDYKTSDSADTPRKAHNRSENSKEWIDLQLPLYRHLATGLQDVQGNIQLGYILLPQDTQKVQFVDGDWTPQELAAADEVAREVIRKIRQGIFWKPTDPPPPYADFLAPICRDGVLEKLQA